MSMTSFWCGCSLFAFLLGADRPSVDGPPLKVASPATKVSKQKHYVVQIKLIEIDEEGNETVLGTPQVKTTGGNAGISIDHNDGRHFDFTINLRTGKNADGSGRELAPAAIPGELNDASVESRLDQKISLKAEQQTRREVLREVAQQAGINIAIDPESAKSVRAQLETPIDFQVEGESVNEVLDRIVQPLKLGYAVKHEVVLIAVAEKLLPDPEEYSVKTYEVADLVAPKAGTGEVKPEFGALMQQIKSTVQPETWDRKGGAATIRPFNSTSSLVVRQTAPGHLAIERLLDKLRRERPKVIGE